MSDRTEHDDEARRHSVRTPVGLLGMLALVVTTEFLVGRHEIDLVAPIAWEWKDSNSASTRKVAGCEVLCFGDSLVKLGVLPRVLEQRTGLKTYNLAMAGGQMPSNFVLFRRAIRSGAKPRMVVLDLTPQLLAEGLSYNVRQWPDLLWSRDCLEIARTARDASFFASVMLARCVPTYKIRHDIRASLMRSLRGQALSLRTESGSHRRNWRVNQGALVFAKNPNCKDLTVPAGTTLPPSDWKCNPVNAQYLERFLGLARQHGIEVVALLPPASPGIQDIFDRKGETVRFDRFLDALQTRWPDLCLIDGRRAGYGPTVFVDPVHLDRRGAYAFSRSVSDILHGRLGGLTAAGPTRVALPAFREPAHEIPLEDLEESKVAVASRELAAGGRR